MIASNDERINRCFSHLNSLLKAGKITPAKYKELKIELNKKLLSLSMREAAIKEALRPKKS